MSWKDKQKLSMGWWFTVCFSRTVIAKVSIDFFVFFVSIGKWSPMEWPLPQPLVVPPFPPPFPPSFPTPFPFPPAQEKKWKPNPRGSQRSPFDATISFRFRFDPSLPLPLPLPTATAQLITGAWMGLSTWPTRRQLRWFVAICHKELHIIPGLTPNVAYEPSIPIALRFINFLVFRAL